MLSFLCQILHPAVRRFRAACVLCAQLVLRASSIMFSSTNIPQPHPLSFVVFDKPRSPNSSCPAGFRGSRRAALFTVEGRGAWDDRTPATIGNAAQLSTATKLSSANTAKTRVPESSTVSVIPSMKVREARERATGCSRMVRAIRGDDNWPSTAEWKQREVQAMQDTATEEAANARL